MWITGQYYIAYTDESVENEEEDFFFEHINEEED